MIALLVPQFIHCQWNLLRYNNDQQSIMALADTNNLVAITSGSARFHYSSNQGKTWSSFQSQFEYSWFSDAHFPSDNVGYACGGTAFGNYSNVIVKTTDKGQTWDSVSANQFWQTGSMTLHKLHFFNNDTGMLAGEVGLFLRTFDGGVTFEKVDSTVSRNVNEIHFTEKGKVFIGVQKVLPTAEVRYTIELSNDFGNTWQTVYSDTMSNTNGIDHRTINKIQMVNAVVGYAVGGNGLFLKTEDGGKSWAKKILQPETNLTALSFISTEVGFINNAGGIHITYDGGVNWQAQKVFPLDIIYQIEALNERVAYAFGTDGIYKLTDIGQPNSNGLENETNNEAIKIFPNPVHDKLFLTGEMSRDIKISILNLNGQVVQQESQASSEIDVSALSAGPYTLLLNDDSGAKKLSFIKQ